MIRGKKVKYLLFAVFFIAIVSSSFGARADDDDARIYVKIIDAYYMDFEGDGKENDVIVDFIVALKIDDDFYDDDDDDDDYKYKFTYGFLIDLEVDLELPSGLKYKYDLVMRIDVGWTIGKLVYINHATEPGWYETSIKAYSEALGTKAYDKVIFDPPGGDDGDEPNEIKLYY